MGFSEKLETRLDMWLRQKAPVQLPAETRKGLAGALWWIALLVGIVQLWGAWVLWHAGHFVERASKIYSNEAPGVKEIHLGLFYWVSLICISLVAILMLLSSPKLKKMQKSGWNLLFYAMLLNAAFAVLRLLSGVDGIIGGFLSAVIGSVLGGYLLFQARDQFGGKRPAHAAVEPEKHHAEKHED
jgi:hypothetical protein